MPIVSRFAPAPTGYLHLGHVVNAIFVWGVTRAAGGRVLLRIEDHDRQRCRPEYESALLDDLTWLGFEPDEPPLGSLAGPTSRFRQRDRHDIYEAALARLRALGRIYACECSRRDLVDDAGSIVGERRYPGTCARRHLETEGRGLRVRLDTGDEHFDDLRYGPQTQCPARQCGDLLIRDRAGNWTYQFAVTVDDDDQRVNLIVRGDDLLASTGRQLQLARLLGRAVAPVFLHHGLVMKSASQKLSKADGDTSVRDMRARGYAPARLLGMAAHAAGLAETSCPLTLDEAVSLAPLAELGARAAAALRARAS